MIINTPEYLLPIIEVNEETSFKGTHTPFASPGEAITEPLQLAVTQTILSLLQFELAPLIKLPDLKVFGDDWSGVESLNILHYKDKDK
jgi:hypothetical protein